MLASKSYRLLLDRTLLARPQAGFSAIEMLTILAIISILSVTAMANLKVASHPAIDASFQLSEFLSLNRTRAVSTTQFVRLVPDSVSRINTFVGASCATATTLVEDRTFALSSQAELTATDWSVCFSPRGLAESAVSIVIVGTGSAGGTRIVQVALGGGTRVL